MGLFYSLLSYVYSYPDALKLSETKILLSSSRLMKYLKLRQQKLQAETKKLEMQLLFMINSPQNIRSMQGQMAIVQNILANSQLFAAYGQIIQCANTIKVQAKTLQKEPHKISNRCYVSICSIVFCYQQMHLNQCIKLSQFIPQPYPQIKQSQLTEDLQKYIIHEKPSMYQINMYILEMCTRNNISLQKINEVGHNFVQKPVNISKKFQETKSSQLFALQFEDMEQLQAQYNAYDNQCHNKDQQNGDFAY